MLLPMAATAITTVYLQTPQATITDMPTIIDTPTLDTPTPDRGSIALRSRRVHDMDPWPQQASLVLGVVL